MKIGNFTYDKNNKYHRLLKNSLIIVVSLYIFVMLWWIISLLAHSVAVPTPADTFSELITLFSEGDKTNGYTSMWAYIGSSMKTFLLGFLIAFLIAVPFGLLLGFSKDLNSICTPAIEVLRPIAPIAWAPIFILSINYTIGPILVVAVGIFFPLLTNVIFGVQKIDPKLIDASRTLGANNFQIFTKVMVPCSIPYVMNGIKIGLGVGWMCIIAAELYAPSLGGIGNFLSQQASLGSWEAVFASLIVIAVMGLITTGVAEYFHKFTSKRMGLE